MEYLKKAKTASDTVDSETIDTVNRAICHGTPFASELVEYDEWTGRSIQRFYRRGVESQQDATEKGTV